MEEEQKEVKKLTLFCLVVVVRSFLPTNLMQSIMWLQGK